MALNRVTNAMLEDDAGGGGAAKATVAEIKGLDVVTQKSVELIDPLLSGHFDRVSSDLSARLVTRTVTSTLVAGNTFTAAAHGLLSGQVLVSTTTANGVTASTKFWVIRTGANTFQLATSYANMRSATAFALTGTTNMTFKRLLDPLEGMFIITTGQAITGENGAWVRRWDRTNIFPQWFGATLDGTDDRQAIMAALEVAAEYEDYSPTGGGYVCRLPAGTIGFNGEIYNYRNASLMGAGRAKTVLKNLSLTENAVTFERGGSYGPTPGSPPWASGGLNTSFGRIGGFTLEQNESAGRGLYVGGQYSIADDIMVRNQGGADVYAVTLEGCTLSGWQNLDIVHSNCGLRMIEVYYPTLDRVSIEATEGYAIHATNCTCISMKALYVDPWDQNTRDGLCYFDSCPSIDLYSVTAELPAAAAIDALGWFHFDNCEGVRVRGGRINHSATQDSKCIFLLEGCGNVNIEGIEWIETTSNMSFLRSLSEATKGLRVANVYTRHAGGAGRDGVLLASVSCSDVIIENWVDVTGVCTHTILATRFVGMNTASNITLTSGTIHTLINCRGANGGAVIGSAQKINSA